MFDVEGNLLNGPADKVCDLPICNGSNGSWDLATCRPANELAQLEKPKKNLEICNFSADGDLLNGPVDKECLLPICNGSNGAWDMGTCKPDQDKVDLGFI